MPYDLVGHHQPLPIWLIGHSPALVKRRKFMLSITGGSSVNGNNNTVNNGEHSSGPSTDYLTEYYGNIDGVDKRTYKMIEKYIKKMDPNLCVNHGDFIHSSQNISTATKIFKEKQEMLQKIRNKNRILEKKIKRSYEEKYNSNIEKLEKVMREQQQKIGASDENIEDLKDKVSELKELQKEKKKKKKELQQLLLQRDAKVGDKKDQPDLKNDDDDDENDGSDTDNKSCLTKGIVVKKENELKQITEKMVNLKDTKKKMVWLLRQVITAEKKRKDSSK